MSYIDASAPPSEGKNRQEGESGGERTVLHNILIL